MKNQYKCGSPQYKIADAIEELTAVIGLVDKLKQETGIIALVEQLRIETAGVGDSVNSLSPYYRKGYPKFDPKNVEHVKEALENAYEAIELERKRLEKAHKENEDAIKNNQGLRVKVANFMEAVGIPQTYTEWELPSPRHTHKKPVKKQAGWSLDLQRLVPISDGYDSCVNSLDSRKHTLDRLKSGPLRDLELESRKKEEEANKKQKEQDDLKLLGRFEAKYGVEGSWSDILEAVLQKDKYLHLAHHLLLNRNNWSDGYSHAENGLNGFAVETERDRAIYKDISHYMGENWGGDGRVFRDCEWNYTVLFGLVDEGLMTDYNQVVEKVGVDGF